MLRVDGGPLGAATAAAVAADISSRLDGLHVVRTTRVHLLISYIIQYTSQLSKLPQEHRRRARECWANGPNALDQSEAIALCAVLERVRVVAFLWSPTGAG